MHVCLICIWAWQQESADVQTSLISLRGRLHVLLHQLTDEQHMESLKPLCYYLPPPHETPNEGHISANTGSKSHAPYLSVSLMFVHHPSLKRVWYQCSSERVIKYARIRATNIESCPWMLWHAETASNRGTWAWNISLHDCEQISGLWDYISQELYS